MKLQIKQFQTTFVRQTFSLCRSIRSLWPSPDFCKNEHVLVAFRPITQIQIVLEATNTEISFFEKPIKHRLYETLVL